MKQENRMKKEDNRIITVLVALSILFIGLIIYLTYFEVFKAESVQNNTYNKRMWMEEEYILRGSIYDRNHILLAYSTQAKDLSQTRHYEYGSLYSHIIGYSNKTLGKEGLEKTYNKELLNISESPSYNEIRKIMAQSNFQQKGNNLILTINHNLQQYTNDILGKQKGSIIAMNPNNGEIYAMVSYPNFDPNTMEKDWESIHQNEDSPLINRATQGLYAPGSIFKIITTTSALEHQNIDTDFYCKGQININGRDFKDYNSTAHGSINLHQAFVKSCNVSFGQIALQLGKDSLKETAEKFMLNQKIPFDITTNISKFSKDSMDALDLAYTGIGQGKTLVTPLNMAMMVSAIANDGNMVQPLLVKEIISSDGEQIKEQETKVLSRTMNRETASLIKDMMIDVVNKGTGKKAKLSYVQVAGKTGTAEVEGQKNHTWFVGFAPAEQPKVAVVVILENSGSTGGNTAAPIARNIIAKALELIE
ncbi:peptidoglycan D,D-transpeptidase FtsI family protein [Garciella nitratireducens]|uniref:Peptidoglycan glycosyltransferase n=1 Tax=Garciella nitratireducens DSM 15102 TaxID=1121911 RepID=A0A1T4P2A3_9FIRM|nr:penicillin-binding transpeptidase domain-containing protein [Garciella nitratireducens]SJZ85645.1 peptidoglycan glycosyltransferase [Garciella nitratireducens DSM 15102]